jgi:hypothetical protein
MKTSRVLLVMMLFVVILLSACSGRGALPSVSAEAPRSPSVSPVSNGSGSFVPAGSLPEWIPEPYEMGAHQANLNLGGVLAGSSDRLYFKAGDNELYASGFDGSGRKKVADDCFGMINVTADAVFFVGAAGGNIYHCSLDGKDRRCIFTGEVDALLTLDSMVYFIGEGKLCRMDQDGTGLCTIVSGVSWGFLGYHEGFLYFYLGENELDHELCAVALGSSEYKAVARKGFTADGFISEDTFIYLGPYEVGTFDAVSQQKTMIVKDAKLVSHALNGNRLFYVLMSNDEEAFLYAYDLMQKKTACLGTVHPGSICFAGSKIYLVGQGDMAVESVGFQDGTLKCSWIVPRELAH